MGKNLGLIKKKKIGLINFFGLILKALSFYGKNFGALFKKMGLK
jgi:hypothetical protein